MAIAIGKQADLAARGGGGRAQPYQGLQFTSQAFSGVLLREGVAISIGKCSSAQLRW